MRNPNMQSLWLLIVFHKVNETFGKLYCYPSRAKIRELLSKYHNIDKSLPSLDRWIRDARDNRHITRTGRTKIDKKRGKIFQSSLTTITLQGYHLLAAAGLKVWKAMEKRRAEGMKIGGRALAKRKGLEHIKTIINAPMIYGVIERTELVEK